MDFSGDMIFLFVRFCMSLQIPKIWACAENTNRHILSLCSTTFIIKNHRFLFSHPCLSGKEAT